MKFYKYQGTGNDFIMIDNRNGLFDKNNQSTIEKLCDRRFGIGADGLILLEINNNHIPEMVYYNSDGRTSSMCGNGGRCFAAFCKQFNLAPNENLTFNAIDGLHEAKWNNNIIQLKMSNVNHIIQLKKNEYELNTGSPHYIIFTDKIQTIDIIKEAHQIRYHESYKKQGINVNFVEILNSGQLAVRTYERGVEDETFSCGTGVTAAAIAYHELFSVEAPIHIQTKGGNLSVNFKKDEIYHDIWLNGPAEFVFEGILPF